MRIRSLLLLIMLALALGPAAEAQLTAGWEYPAVSSYTTAAADNGKVLASDSVPGASITVTLPSPASVGTAWTMGFSTGGGRGITVNAPNSVYILTGQKQMTSFSAPSNTNYEFFALQSDGSNFRLLSATKATAQYNGAVAQNQGAWTYLSGGYAATLADGGTVLSSAFAGAPVTVTLPSAPLLPNGWSVSFYTASANPITVQPNAVQGGSLIAPGGAAVASYTFPANSLFGVLSFDGAAFRVISAPSGTVDIRQFGAVAGQNNATAMANWLAYACANNVGLFLPDGDWQTSAAQSVSVPNGCKFTITAQSPNAEIDYIGTGAITAILKLDGSATSAANSVSVHGATISGNGNAQYALWTNAIQRGHFDQGLRLRNVVTSGMYSTFAVTNYYDISCSNNEGAYMQQPQSCFKSDNGQGNGGTYNSTIHIVAEGLAGTGVDLDYSNDNEIHGTSEGNARGVWLHQHANDNVAIKMDNESNSIEDYRDDGTDNTTINFKSCCRTGGAALYHIGPTAFQPKAIGGWQESTTIDAGAFNAQFYGVRIKNNGGTLSDLGTFTSYIDVTDATQTSVVSTNLAGTVSTIGAGLASLTGTPIGIGRLFQNDNTGTKPFTCEDFADIDSGSQANPVARVCSKITGTGSSIVFGTSNNFASGITTQGPAIDQNGNFGTAPVAFAAMNTACNAANEGLERAITDSTSATPGAAVSAGGGTHHALLYCAGSPGGTYSWVVATGQ